MDEEEIQKRLRIAIHGDDGPAILATLGAAGIGAHRLQMAGIALLIASRQDRERAEPLVRSLIESLAGRGWEGDEELSAELAGALGTGPVPTLADVPVQLSELAFAMSTNNYGGRIDLRNGDVYAASEFGDNLFFNEEDEEADEEEEGDGDHWLGIEPSGSRVGWNDMADFIDTVSDPGRADRLSIAIEGRGAFRRFKDVLHRWEDETGRWYAFSEDRGLGRARQFLAAEGFRATRY